MWCFASFNRGYILIHLLLLLPDLFFNYSISLEPERSQVNYLQDFIQNVIKEKPANILLLLKRRQDHNCLLKEFNPYHLIPTLRLDESTTINVKDHFNSEAIALVCMSELADSMLLTSLAKDLHRMRESRVIIWLQNNQSNPRAFLDIITDQASNHNFLSLIVLHSTSSDVNGSIVAYRLQPFPSPALQRISNILDKAIFVETWLNFNGKTAVILPDLIPPNSLLATDIFTGQQKLYGIYDKLIDEFAKKYNIRLRLKCPINNVREIDRTETYSMTVNGELDLPIRTFLHSVRFNTKNVEHVSVVEVGSIFIVVPCAREMSIGDVYRGLRTYSSIVLGAYFIFAVLETLIVAATYRLIRRRYRFCYANLFINLPAFCGVLGLPFPLARYRTSLSLQQMVMVMSIFSLIFSCFFNANLSTLLIKQPHYKQIDSFEELRESGMTVLFSERGYNYIKNEIDEDFFIKVIPNIQIMPTEQRQRMLLSLNTSYAHHIYTTFWDTVNQFQKLKKQKVLCKSQGLIVSQGNPVSGILKHNSVYKIALEEYMHWTQSMGFYKHWALVACQKLMTSFPKQSPADSQDYTPLSSKDLIWLWKLIGFSYLFSGMVFAVEILVALCKKKRVKRVIIVKL